jgi:transcriptional regulator with XRE-family HTH domain
LLGLLGGDGVGYIDSADVDRRYSAAVDDSKAKRPFVEELGLVMARRAVGQRELARRLSVSQAHISRILSGKMAASQRLIRDVERALELPDDYFIESQLDHIVSVLRTRSALRLEVLEMVNARFGYRRKGL